MSFASLHKLVTYVFAGLGLFALSLGGELNSASLGAIFLAYLGSIFVEGKRLEAPGWQRGWTGALLALALLQIVRGISGEPFLPLALEFTAALQISRLCNRRTAAEHRQIALLSFLHLVSATVLSIEIVYGVAFLGFVVAAPWMLALTHLRAEIEEHYAVTGPAAGDAGRSDEDAAQALVLVRRVLGSRRVVGASFLAGTAALSLPLFVVTAIIFAVFPRIGFGVLSFGSREGEHTAGFGDDVELGQVGVIRDNPTVVMRVVPPGLGEAPPRRASLRLRGTSFDHYDGRRWSRTTRMARSVGHSGFVNIITRAPERSRDERWDVILEHLSEPVVFFPEGTVAIEFPPYYSAGFPTGRTLLVSPGLDVRYDADGVGLRYSAWVATPPDRVAEQLPADELRRYLQVPAGHERVAELAAEWTRDLAGPRPVADRILARLHGAEFSYSLDMHDAQGLPPLEAFLFRDRAGHCEYFSSAMAIMLRMRGVPAREVTGFLGGQWNPFGEYYAISQGDAHSWVEAWIEGEGWVTFDPTPPGRGLADAREGELFAAIRSVLDAISTRWNDDVVSYDLGSQRSLARELAAALGLGGRGGGSAAATPSGSGESRASGSPPYLGLIVLLALGLGYLLWRRRSAARAADAALPAAAREIVQLYRAMEKRLATRGVARAPNRTPSEHAADLAAAGFEKAALVAQITEHYVSVRYGGSTLSPEELARLRESIHEL